jgi:Rrf2 family protein
MRTLRRAGLVRSVRGRKGGYQLARPAAEIDLGAVLASLGGRIYSTDFCGQHRGVARVCVHDGDCSLRAVWMAIDQAVHHTLARTRLSDLLRGEGEMTLFMQPQAFPLRTSP